MIKRLIRVMLRLAVVAAASWGARAAFKRWVEGPDPDPSAWGSSSPSSPPAASDSQTLIGSDDGVTWVAPDPSGAVPASHPVKAKTGSRIYHLPGMSLYERTRPDRCYPTAEAAEADGFIRAKR